MKDITDDVALGWVDDECVQLRRCACGAEYAMAVLSIYLDEPWECPCCHRKLVIAQTTRVLEVENSED